MALIVCRSWAAFEAMLSAQVCVCYAAFRQAQTSPVRLLRLLALAEKNSHADILGMSELSEGALADVQSFFEQAEKIDASLDYSFSSKVLLSIGNYKDVQQLFLLNRFQTEFPERDVLVYLPGKSFQKLVSSIFEGKPYPAFPVLPSLRSWGRFIRALLRVCLNFSSRISVPDFLLLTLSSKSSASFRDVYFGDLPQTIAACGKSVLTVYVMDGKKLLLPSSALLRPLEAFATAKDVIKAHLESIVESLRVASPKVMLGQRDFSSLVIFLKKNEINTGEYFYNRFLKYSFRSLCVGVEAKTVLFPFENRTWEKHLIHTFREAKHSRIVGYQHSSITPRHLSLKQTSNVVSIAPDKVITVGEVTREWLSREAPALKNKIVIGGSLRRIKSVVAPPGKEGVLVAISSSRDEAWAIICKVFQVASKVEIPFVIRSHPTIPITDLYKMFAWPDNVRLSAGGSLEDDLGDASMVMYSSSTVVIEGMLSGRLGIFLDIGDIPSGDPINGDKTFRAVAKTQQEVIYWVNSFASMNTRLKHDIQTQAREYAANYLFLASREKKVEIICANI